MTKVSKLKTPRIQSDAAWKLILAKYFQPFLSFFYSDLADHIDWTKAVETLDKELQQITSTAMIGKRAVDMLFKVHLKTGDAAIILLHVDVQATPDDQFPERMYVYNYLIYNLYKLPVMTLVMLVDDCFGWRPEQYTSEILGYTVTTFNFRAIKLLDWQGKEQELLAQANPFGWIVAAHLCAQKARKAPHEERLGVKLALTRHLYEKGFSRDEILDFYTFLDRLLRLPKSLEIVYTESVHQLESEKHMQIITNMERIGIEKGLQKGLQKGLYQGRLETAKNMLAHGLDQTLIKLVTGLTDKDLLGLGKDSLP